MYEASEEEMKKLWEADVHVLFFPLDRDMSYPDGVIRLGDIVVCETDMDTLSFWLSMVASYLLGDTS